MNTNGETFSQSIEGQNLPTLELGDQGSMVLLLQDKLRVLGYLNSRVTNNFTRTTESAVRRFQQDNGLTQTGVVDEATWNVLYERTGNTIEEFPVTPFSLSKPVLRLGDSGPFVEQLQMQLAQLLYYTDLIDGFFGISTQSAVRQFQSVNNLTVDGIVGRATWAALDYVYSPLAICDGEQTQITHIVQPGETLFSIARLYGTTVDEIIRLNNLTNTNLSIGQELIISGEEPAPQPPVPPVTPTTGIHVVRSGDTLFSLARLYNTTVEELRRLNNLTTDTLSIGQQLIIPQSESSEYIEHTVVSGDTLFSLARYYNTTVEEIRQINNLTSDVLSIGQILRIPGQASVLPPATTGTHIVRSGESLFSIATRYSTTVDELKRLNNLTSDFLNVGQELIVPISDSPYFEYRVVSGDNLYSIARRFDTTIEEIRRLNNLTSNALSIGQILRIPR